MITKLITKRKQPLEDIVLRLTHSDDRQVPEFKQTPEQLSAIMKMLEAIDKRNKAKDIDPFDASEYEEHWGKWAKFRKNWFNQELNPLSKDIETSRKENKQFFDSKREQR